MHRICNIKPLNHASMDQCRARWDAIAKPIGSFGLLEDMIVKIAGIQGTPDPDISTRTAVIFCGDHGVTAQGVTQTGSEVTAICAEAIASGRSNVNSLAKIYGADVVAVDMGMLHPVDHPNILDRRVGAGTKDISLYPAMTRDQATQCIRNGIDIAYMMKMQGVKLLLTGEMGIGNTTCASALSALVLRMSPDTVTGRGAGLSDEGLMRKKRVVRNAILLHQPTTLDPVGMLASIGGFEVAGMVGLYLGGAIYGVPVVIDGVISAVAAAVACLIEPYSVNFMLASHRSGEPAGEGLLSHIGLKAPIRAGLRLGEGTGAMLLLPLLDGALSLYKTAHTFDDEGIPQYESYAPEE